MRLLLVNPNTDRAASEAIRHEAMRTAAPGTHITVETAPRGPASIVTPDDTERAGPVVVEVMSRFADRIDGAVTAAYSDPGLELARRAFSFPVLGIGEASMKEAARLGAKIVIVSSNPANEPTYRSHAALHGVADRLSGIRFISRPAYGTDRDVLVDEVVFQANLATERNEADVIVVAGGPLAGIAAQAAARVPVPLLDCVGCAVTRIERWLATGSPD